MSRIFNRLVKTRNKCVILLYGEICDTEVNATDIKQELLEAESMGKPIEIRINSVGGDVYTGIAIIQAINECKGDLKIFIDGAAASIAAVIALCGKPLEMGRYSRLMIHQVTGGGYGTQEALFSLIEEMRNIEDSLSDIIARKCNKTPEEIKMLYFDGQDHWFSSAEALEMGLIDSIFENEPMPDAENIEDVYNITNRRVGLISRKDYKAFKCRLNNALKLDQYADEDEILKTINRLKIQKDKADSNEALEKAVKKGWIENSEKEMFHALAKYDIAAFVEKMQELEANDKAEVIEIICEAEKMGKIVSFERDIFKNIGEEMGASLLADVLNVRPQKKLVKRQLELDFENRADWTLSDWKNFAPQDLANNPILYELLSKSGNRKGTGFKNLDWYRKNNPEYLKENPHLYKELINKEFNQK